MATDMTAKLTLEASTSGEDKLQGVADALHALGQGAGQATPELNALAGELDKLAREQALIDQFKQLKEQTAGWADAAAKAQQAAKESALALKAQQAALASAQAGEQALVQTLARARDEHARMGEAIKGAQQELRELGAASKAAGADAQGYAQRTQEVRAQLAVLRTAYQDSGAQVKQLASEQRAAAAATREVGAGAKVAEAAFERNRRAAAGANQAYDASRVALQRQRDAMGEVGISSTNLAAAQVQLNTRLEQVRGSVARVGSAHVQMAREAQTATATAVRSHRELSEKVHSISSELAVMRNAYVGLQTVLGGLRAAKGLADTADAVSNLQARIKLATGDGELFNAMWARVAETAQATHSSLQETGMLFARVAQTGKDAGLSAQQAAEQSLAVVQTINQAVQLSGGSAESAQAAITQLIQGLQSGVLRGEEFNSVMEQAPRLSRVLADALGVTLGQLRAMAEQGKLTSEIVVGALKSQAQAVRAEFDALPATIGRAVQDLGTAWSLFIGETDKAHGASQRIAGAIDLVAANLGTLMEAAATAGKLMVVLFAARMLRAVQGYASAVLQAVRGTDALALSNVRAADSIAATNAQMARWMSLARGLGHAAIASEVMTIVGNYVLYREELKKHVALNAEVEKKQVQVAQRLEAISRSTGVAVTSMQEFDVAVRRGLIVLDEASGKWLSAAQAQEQLADAAHKTADALAGAAGANLVRQFADLERQGKSTGEALKALVEGLDFSRTGNVDALVRAFNALQAAGEVSAREVGTAWEQALVKMNPAQLDQAVQALGASYQQMGLGADALGERMGAVLDRLGASGAQALGLVSQGARDALAGMDTVTAAMKATGANANQMAGALELAFKAAIPKMDSVQALDELQAKLAALAQAGSINTTEFNRMSVALAEQRQKVEDATPGIQSMDEALRALGANGAQALGQVSTSAQAAINALDAVAEAATQAGIGAEKAARAIELAFLAAIPKADSLEAIKVLEERLKAMGAAGQIGAAGIARVQQELAKQKAAIEGQLPGIQSLEEALRNLGVKPRAELQRLAAEAKESFDYVRQSGTASTREVAEAWRAMAEAAIAANDGVATQAIKSGAAQYGFAVETDKAGKSIVKSMQEAADATAGVGTAAQKSGADMAGMAGQAVKSAQDLAAQARAHQAALEPVVTTWLDAKAAASEYAQQLAAVVWAQGKSIAAMRQEHAQLVVQMQRLADQQKQLKESDSDAARGVDELRLRLVELNGTEEDIARARHARDVAQVQRKMALMAIDLQRAQIAKQDDEATRLNQELALLREQLKLLDQVAAAEARQRRTGGRAGGANTGSSGGASGGLFAPSPAGGGAPVTPSPAGRGQGWGPAPVNITLNANGVNDPVQLARLIEPEMKRLARLAR